MARTSARKFGIHLSPTQCLVQVQAPPGSCTWAGTGAWGVYMGRGGAWGVYMGRGGGLGAVHGAWRGVPPPHPPAPKQPFPPHTHPTHPWALFTQPPAHPSAPLAHPPCTELSEDQAEKLASKIVDVGSDYEVHKAEERWGCGTLAAACCACYPPAREEEVGWAALGCPPSVPPTAARVATN